ncbi:uncharacterized protein LOC107411799 isoform X2 [Ziziphus jujuba]|uniref:Uncharacterized protein LOC107411799 isoform X2 n=1 Tax=Ziziphus jujuba TaxID=326968 RepID=A0A6P6FZW2_ZIZJJ|nr:uncharacterized protein LOC107411799 isoform X2 [Ziziphus jujuba]
MVSCHHVIYRMFSRLLLSHSGMGLDKRTAEIQNNNGKAQQTRTVCTHAFYDLTYISPVVFIYLLKECYVYGTCKATKKFRGLQQQVHLVLHNDPQRGPAIFVLQCLYVLPIFGLYCEGFSHLIVSALRRFLKKADIPVEAKDLATQLFLDIVRGFVKHDERVVVKILEVFDVQLTNIEKAMCPLKENNDGSFDTAKTFVEQYIYELIESQSYMNAVTLLEHFSIRQSGQSFLHSMLQYNEFKAAEKWAAFIGKPLLCVLVQYYVDRNMLNNAYEMIKKNNLQQEFPDVYHKCKESSLKKLAEKGCWDVAEAKANKNRQLLEYLVYLAMEAGYSEKVDELCDRYSLEGFLNDKVPEASLLHSRYLDLNELVVEDIIWVDEPDALLNATCHIEGCKVVGVDCEWKPNYIKGNKPNKVSIMQISSDKMVFIFDLLKLFEDVPDILDNCLTRILQSPRILKLGYNFQCDIKQLAHSYKDLLCFKHYEMLLDIQNIFKEPRGGLSGLAKKILGAGLNKTRRNSNWEQRPLTRNQLEYAALDAAVLIHIFRHVRSHPYTADAEAEEKIEWKSHILSHIDNVKKSKKENRKQSKADKERWQFEMEKNEKLLFP